MIYSWYAKKSLKKQLLDFLGEMEKNLEIYYVMDQRQFITGGFIMDTWEKVKDLEILKSQEAIQLYASTLLAFNSAFNENKTFEKWYSSSLEHRTPENAKKLHAFKNDLDQRVKTLEAIIIPAGQSLEKELLKLGFITN
ncbi:MAG: hypothetical protein HQL15_05515 [Candidatus Omnitrophica bacterium]|nr:hypothetical protein [Candidatus Omnitrophota bacterium]